MSKLGKKLIDTIEDARKKGLISLETTPDIVSLRKKLCLSQKKFAKTYHINPETLKKWEQRKRNPDAISRVYLKCIAKQPKTIARMLKN